MELLQLQQEVKELVITNDTELENANALAKEANALIKKVKAKHKEDISKYYALHKEAKTKEKEELMPIENAKEIIKNAICDYMKIVEQRQLEEQKQQQEEQDLFGETLTLKTEKPDLKGTHIRKTWKARIVDEDKVPVKYGNVVIRKIDMSKLNDIAKFEEGKANIPGIEFYQDETVVIR